MRFGGLLFVAFLLVTTAAQAGHTLEKRHRQILDAWLRRQPHVRLATADDCACPEDIKMMRAGFGGVWVAIPNYQPYVVTGDFNCDGANDFAVALINDRVSDHKFTLVVFNGPFDIQPSLPAFQESGLDLRGQGFFYGPPRPKPYRLLVGRFELEGAALEPKGKSYEWQYDER